MKFDKMANQISKLLKDEGVEIDSSLSNDVISSIELWSKMYKNEATWIDNKVIKSACIPSSIAGEIARLTTLEAKIEVDGSAKGKFINDALANVKNKLREYVEYGCAKGSLIFKPYLSGNGISVQIVQADCFFPVAFDDSGNITRCVFTEQFRDGRNIYTRLEIHTLKNEKLTITNRAFRSMSDDVLGSEINIATVPQWSKLQYSTTFANVSQLPFGYYRFPIANEFNAPIGASCYSKAVHLIAEADRRYSQECWEFEAKEAAVNIAESMMFFNKETGSYQAPKGKERLYRPFRWDSGVTDKPFMNEYSPDIRIEQYAKGYEEQLRKIEFSCSLAYGTLSNINNVDKTAEEIKTSKQRSYAMVSDNQKALQGALEQLIYALDFYVTVYNLVPNGKINTQFEWDDSIIVDSEKERMRDMQEVTMGIMPKYMYIMKWYGVDEDKAKMIISENTGTDGLAYGDE